MTHAAYEHMHDTIPAPQGKALTDHLDARSAEGWELVTLFPVAMRVTDAGGQPVPGTFCLWRRPKKTRDLGPRPEADCPCLPPLPGL